MKKIKLLLSIFITLLTAYNCKAQFVSAKNHQFLIGGKPYYYIGANYWYGGLLNLTNEKNDLTRLRKELDFLKSQGINNLRVLAAAEGSGFVNGVQRVSPPLQPEQGKFDSKVLENLDVFLYELGKRNMKAILYLSNNWEWSGGFLQYLRWNNQIPDSVFRRKLNWNEMRDYVSNFYTCNSCKTDYLKQVSYILNHTNALSKKRYINDPAIMAWELANEPRPMRPAADSAYKDWVKNVSAFIKSKDKNHLVTAGVEGEQGTESMQLFQDIHANKSIDYLTIHIWPKNWGWFRDTSINKSFDRVVSNTNNYIDKHIAVAEKLQKPLVLEEFGLPRDGHSFNINSATSLRDIYYNNVFSAWQKSKYSNGVLAGVNFWTFGGIVHPHPNQIAWKQGDDYLGDPPMEEQGLNSVFDTDTSTWKLVTAYSKKVIRATSLDNLPVDKKATKQTIALYHNLKKLMNKGVMIGHQDALAYGVNWKYIEGKSDIKDVTGDYPAFYGYELADLELDHPVNIDSVPFDKMKNYIRKAYARGGVVELSWHFNNPLTGESAWKPAPGTVSSILPGGEKHELYKSWLDKGAKFLTDLKGKNGEAIPIILRLFHESNGNWFWWGTGHCTADEYKQLWHFTVSYLRNTKQLHNLLIAFNYDKINTPEDYMINYPGDEWTDIIGCDSYQGRKGPDAGNQFYNDMNRKVNIIEEIAQQRNKIPALTEMGFNKIPDSTWWTDVLLKILQNHKLSYVLLWRNAGLKKDGSVEYYAPYKGHPSEKNFTEFYKEKITLFQKDLSGQNLYKQ